MQHDIFHDDQAYAEFDLRKQEQERMKKERIDKVLDEYCWTQLNLPASEYRSQHTDLIYKPQKYVVNVVHPAHEAYTSQFIGFNQVGGDALHRRPKYPVQRQIPQQMYYPQQQMQPTQQSTFQQTGSQLLQQPPSMPGVQVGNGNLLYDVSMFANQPNNDQQVYQIGPGRAMNQIRKRDILYRSAMIERNIDHTMRMMQYGQQ